MITSAQQNNLYDYLKEHNSVAFELGKHDCLTFTNDAFRVLYGSGWADDAVGNYTTKSGKLKSIKLLKGKFQKESYKEFIDSRLNTYEGFPTFGMLVGVDQENSFGLALGICVGVSFVAVGESGLVYTPIQDAQYCWSK